MPPSVPRWGADPERILMAAAVFDPLPGGVLCPGHDGYPGAAPPGKVMLCGFRHGDITRQLLGLLSLRRLPRMNQDQQGFLTSRGRFVGRREAAQIAVTAGQIEVENLRSGELYSEDLW